MCSFLMTSALGIILVSYNELRQVLSFSIFWKSLCRVGINFLNVCYKSPVKPYGPGLSFVGSFKIT